MVQAVQGTVPAFYKWRADSPGIPARLPGRGRQLCIYLLEPKSTGDLNDDEVKLKRDVAVKWCVYLIAFSVSSAIDLLCRRPRSRR